MECRVTNFIYCNLENAISQRVILICRTTESAGNGIFSSSMSPRPSETDIEVVVDILALTLVSRLEALNAISSTTIFRIIRREYDFNAVTRNAVAKILLVVLLEKDMRINKPAKELFKRVDGLKRRSEN